MSENVIGRRVRYQGEPYTIRGINPDGTYDLAPIDQEQDLRSKMDQRGFFGNFAQGLTSNEPTQGVGGWLGRGALPMVGGGIGAVGGFIGGLGVGSVPGAGIGGAAGEATRQAIVSAVNPQERWGQTAGGALDIGKDVAVTGALSAVGQKGGEMVARGGRAAYQAIAPRLATLASKVPERSTTAAVRGQLKGAPSVKEASEAYATITGRAGLKSLDQHLKAATGKELNVTPADFMKVAERMAAKHAKGKLTPQDALWGRQAIQKVKQSPRFGKEEMAGVARQLDDMQRVFDDALEAAIPGYGQVRTDYFRAKAAEDMMSWFPLNKDGTANVLRPVMVGSAGANAAFVSGNPIPLLSPLATSPRINYGRISALNEAGPVAAGALKRAGPLLRPAAEKGMEALRPREAHAAPLPTVAPEALPELGPQPSGPVMMDPVEIQGRQRLNLQPIRHNPDAQVSPEVEAEVEEWLQSLSPEERVKAARRLGLQV